MNGHTIPNTPIAVDFWKIRQTPQAKIFFLSHCHADHMEGLTSTWSRPIYCSEVTAEILKEKINIRPELLHPLEINRGHIIPLDEEGLETMTVILINANHCPGAAMFLFEGYFGKVLYTGDFRFHKDIFKEIGHATGNIDVLYLDNTYCSPSCIFPSREDCEKAILRIVAENPDAEQIIIGVRNLGKEDLLVKIAERNQEWIGVSATMLKTAEILNLPDVFTEDSDLCRIRTEPVHFISRKSVQRWSNELNTVVIIPSALYLGLNERAFSNFANVHIVPYSDHSSYSELLQFVSILKPRRVLPIVRGNAKGPLGLSLQDRANMDCFSSFLDKTPLTPVFVPPSVKNFMKSQTGTRLVSHTTNRGRVYRTVNKRSSKSQNSHKGVLFLDYPEKCQKQNEEEVVSPDSTSSILEVDKIVLNAADSTIGRANQQFVTLENCDTTMSDSTKRNLDTEQNFLVAQDVVECSSSQSQESFFDCCDAILASGTSEYSTPKGQDVEYDCKNSGDEFQNSFENSDLALAKPEPAHHKIEIYFKDGDLMTHVHASTQCTERKTSSKCDVDDDQVENLAEDFSLVSSQKDETLPTMEITKNIIVSDMILSENDRDWDIRVDIESSHLKMDNSFDIVNYSARKQEQNNESNNADETLKGEDVPPENKADENCLSPDLNEGLKVNTLIVLKPIDDFTESYDFCKQPFVPRTDNSPNYIPSTQIDEPASEQSENSPEDFCTQPFVPQVDTLPSDNNFSERLNTVSSTEWDLTNQFHLLDDSNSSDKSDYGTVTLCEPKIHSTNQIHFQDYLDQIDQSSDFASQSDNGDVDQSNKHNCEIDSSRENTCTLEDEVLDSNIDSEDHIHFARQSNWDGCDSSQLKRICVEAGPFVCSKDLVCGFSQNALGGITQHEKKNVSKSMETIECDTKNGSLVIDIETSSLTNCEKLTIQLSDSFESIDKTGSKDLPVSLETKSNENKKNTEKLCRKRLRLSSEETNSETENKIFSEEPKLDTCKRRKSDEECIFVGFESLNGKISNSKQKSSLQSIKSFFRPIHSNPDSLSEIDSKSDDGFRQQQYQKSIKIPLEHNTREKSETESTVKDTIHFQSKVLSSTKSTVAINKANNENIIECGNSRRGMKRTLYPGYSVMPSNRKRTKLDRRVSLLQGYKDFCKN